MQRSLTPVRRLVVLRTKAARRQQLGQFLRNQQLPNMEVIGFFTQQTLLIGLDPSAPHHLAEDVARALLVRREL